MKLYIGTLIERTSYGDVFVQTHVSDNEWGLTVAIDDALAVVEAERGIEIPRDYGDLVIECRNGNQHSEPFSIGEDEPGAPEFLLSTLIVEV